MEYRGTALTDRDKLVRRAGTLVHRAIRNGKLPHFSTFKCADCEKPAECYDHRDYTKPLDVDPVCRGCNNRRGAGWPPPAEGDHAANKHGLGKATGVRWGGIGLEGDGYEPLAAHLNGITAADLENVLTANEADFKIDLGLAQLHNRDNRATGVFHTGEAHGMRRPTGVARADFFKRKDRWYA